MFFKDKTLLITGGIGSRGYRWRPDRSPSGYVSEKKYPEDMRMVEFYDVEKEVVTTFITNNFDLWPLVIANIYRNRWQLELFSKGSR